MGAVTGVTEAMGTSSKPSGKGKKLPFLQDTCYRCGKGKHQKVPRTVELWTQCAEVVEKRDTLRKSVSRLNIPHIHSEVPQASTSTAGAGATEPLYFDDDGQPVFTHMVSVLHASKHLIKFPIALDYMTLRGRNKIGKFHRFYWSH